MVRKEPLERWSVEKSAELYNIRSWSAGYFDINDKGEVVYQYKTKQGTIQVSLMDIIRGIRARGLSFPVLLRISNILDSQITLLHESFRKAIQSFGYKGRYQGVFPIKVNQQQQVLEEVSEFGSRYHHGFEAGSKAELLAALAFLKDPEAIIVCNGYKDSEFIDLGLYATKLGYRCIFVIEMPSEADLILERSRLLGVEPWIGVRIKLSSKASGHWTESGGDRSIFGLSLPEVVELVDKLKKENALGWLRLLHYHVGSQIPNIRDIRSAVQEATRVYVGLVSEGAPMGFVDFGGGLAVDYDGSQTNYHSSRNYTVEEYCADIVETVMSIVDEHQIDHPTIVTESGRFLVAYYSVLVFNILDVTRFTPAPPPEKLPEGTHELTQNLFETYQKLSIKNLQESINDAIYYRDQIRDIFKHGDISLRERALAENIFWNIVSIVSEKSRGMKKIPVEIEGIEVALSDIYYGNFSVFQSLPDTWAIDQVFPVMPLHRLDTMPTREAIISDITCDSDGKLDHFIDPHGEKLTLPLHELKGDEEYYVGVFLVGAYQETLGDLHNLLGDTNVVTIRVNEDGTYNFVSEIEGDSVADVLSYVEYDIKYIRRRFREMAEKAVSENRISVQERASILKALEDGLDGYTYYEKD
ncbi:Biosynthetic arginine decarboxylase [Brevinematales bacterium NS]|nr:Biosynthetic arginine decarboxylase [Brevinematales bacterium NS]